MDPEIFSLCQLMDAGQRSASAAELQPRISSQSTSAKFVVWDFPLDVLLHAGVFPEHGACCLALCRQSVLNSNIFQ